MDNSKTLGRKDSSTRNIDTTDLSGAYEDDVENQASHNNDGFDSATYEKAPKDPNIVD
jgi:hypothetical protein